MGGRVIKSVRAQEVYTKRIHPGIEVIVATEGGHEGRAVCTGGHSIGTHEVQFAYDGGEKWGGKGVKGAVDKVNTIIAPTLAGLDAADQSTIDRAMLELYPNAKAELGGNAVAAVSAAALKAGAASAGVPLYRHIGGQSAMYLPVPGIPTVNGDKRWGGGVTTPGTKPTYSFMMYGFDSFAEASYTGWEIQQLWTKVMGRYGIRTSDIYGFFEIPEGMFRAEEEIWALMAETIHLSGYEGKVGIQVDVAADTYYNRKDQKYYGLFSDAPKNRDGMMELYIKAVSRYPFVIIEDPFFEDDFESHAELVQQTDIQIVGDDLFTTDTKRVLEGGKIGAANAVLLKVNQIGTISEALEMVQLAYKLGYGVMPCESRGEGAAIADYCVGINAGSVREMAIGETGNRFLEIERELGSKAKFLGAFGLQGKRFRRR